MPWHSFLMSELVCMQEKNSEIDLLSVSIELSHSHDKAL